MRFRAGRRARSPPLHRRSGSVHAANTRSRGARMTRLIFSSAGCIASVPLAVSTKSASLSNCPAPEAPVGGEPFVGARHRRGGQHARLDAAARFCRSISPARSSTNRCLEIAASDMPWGLARSVTRAGPSASVVHQRAARPVGKGVEDLVETVLVAGAEHRRILLNQMVDTASVVRLDVVNRSVDDRSGRLLAVKQGETVMTIHQEVTHRGEPGCGVRRPDAFRRVHENDRRPRREDFRRGRRRLVSMFGGDIRGLNVELVPGKRVVQAWRSSAWPQGVYSIVRFELAAAGKETKLTFDQAGYPEGAHEMLDGGWHQMYWEPMNAMLSGKPMPRDAPTCDNRLRSRRHRFRGHIVAEFQRRGTEPLNTSRSFMVASPRSACSATVSWRPSAVSARITTSRERHGCPRASGQERDLLMQEIDTQRFDQLTTFKANFDQIYTAPDPREYYRVLFGLDYVIPELAKPIFRGLIEKRAETVARAPEGPRSRLLLRHQCRARALPARSAASCPALRRPRVVRPRSRRS